MLHNTVYMTIRTRQSLDSERHSRSHRSRGVNTKLHQAVASEPNLQTHIKNVEGFPRLKIEL